MSERERGWPVDNEGNCHIFFSTPCVTPGCYMSLPLCQATYTSPLFLCENILHLQLCSLHFPSPFTPSLLTGCRPSFPPSVKSACTTFSPVYVEWTERAEQWLPLSLTTKYWGGHWLQVCFFSTVNSNRITQLAYYWHILPQQ